MTGKRLSLIALILCAMMLFAACGGGKGSDGGQEDTEKSTEAAAEFTGDKYVNDGSEYAIKTADLPDGYPLIPIDRFKEGFKALSVGTLEEDATYADVAKAFGDDGIRMDGIKYEGYAYYGWYSDMDYSDGVNIHVLVTFKADGDKLTYYAYTSEGITGEDVQ